MIADALITGLAIFDVAIWSLIVGGVLTLAWMNFK